MSDIEKLSPRLQYLYRQYAEEIFKMRLRESAMILLEYEATGPLREYYKYKTFEKIINSDPTQNKSASQWLITTFIKSERFLEDLPKAKETLVEFIRYKAQLPVEQRSFTHYKTLADMWSAIEPMVKAREALIEQSPEGRAKKRAERERAHRESEFIYQDDKVTIVSPKTRFASCWLGKGTRWCTASENNNMFNSYHKEAPLMVILMPNGNKLQFHIGKNIAFMDAQDRPVTEQYIEDHWDSLGKFFMGYLPDYPQLFVKVPLKFRTLEMCLAGLNQDPLTLSSFPDNFLVRALCLKAVRKNEEAMRMIPARLLTSDFYHEAIKVQPKAIAYFPKEMITPEIVKYVNFKKYFLIYIPYHLQTKSMVFKALKKEPSNVRGANPKFLTRQMIKMFINRDYVEFLQVFPIELFTRELCLLAIKKNASFIRYVPTEFLNEDFYRIALSYNGGILSYVTIEDRTVELCKIAVSQNGKALYYVNDELKTPEVCLDAVKQDGNALEFVPEEKRTRDILIQAITVSPCALRYITEDKRDEEICMLAFNKNPEAIKSIPYRFLTFNMCVKAVRKYGPSIEYVPETYRADVINHLNSRSWLIWYRGLKKKPEESNFFWFFEPLHKRSKPIETPDHSQELGRLREKIHYTII